MPHASLRDVAALAGVSFQTASKVLNGQGAASEATRRRVVDAGRALGYVPNALARGLLSGSTRTVGVVTADFSDTTLARSIVGVEREARRRRWSVLVGSLDLAGSDLERYLRMLIERRVDGVVLNAPVTELTRDTRAQIPADVAVASTHPVRGGGIPRVGIDNLAAGLLAMRHLLAAGRRSVALITGAATRSASRARTRAYRQALEEADLRFDPGLVEAGDWSVEGGYVATHRLLDRRPRLEAIYAQNDMMAVGVLAALHDRARRVPEDCAVVGCDDLPVAAYTVPPLTSTRIPFHEIGETAMRLVLRQLGGERVPEATLLPVELVQRASSAGGRPDGSRAG